LAIFLPTSRKYPDIIIACEAGPSFLQLRDVLHEPLGERDPILRETVLYSLGYDATDQIAQPYEKLRPAAGNAIQTIYLGWGSRDPALDWRSFKIVHGRIGSLFHALPHP
jgi:hypothetical protein